jgi:tRNA (guanine37-N1)-methyltransferase
LLRVEVVTIFPHMVEAPLADGIVQRARDKGLARLRVHDLRAFSEDKHRNVDDAPRALAHVRAEPAASEAVVVLSPRGRRFDQRTAERYARQERLVLLCGRYEGIDERLVGAAGAEELSLGDFVLTGGEVAALAVVEAAVRLLPGALGDSESAEADSFADGLLDHPHFTRPAEVGGRSVPEVLLSGDHARIRRWRRKESLRATRERRPDLLERAALSAADQALLREIENEENVLA